MLEGALVGVQMTNALKTNFCKLPTNQGAQRYHAWRRSSYKQTSRSLPIIPLLYYRYCNNGHSSPILEGALVGVQTMNALGTNFRKLPTSQWAQRYHAWRLSSYIQTSRSLPITHSIAILCNSGHGYAQVGVQTMNTLGTNFLQATHKPGSSEMPCLEAFIIQTNRQESLHYTFIAILCTL